MRVWALLGSPSLYAYTLAAFFLGSIGLIKSSISRVTAEACMYTLQLLQI